MPAMGEATIKSKHLCPGCRRPCELGWTARMRRAWFCVVTYCKWFDTAVYPADKIQRRRIVTTRLEGDTVWIG